MKIKVCGMKYPENILFVSRLSIDYIGFIFHEDSPRYAGGLLTDNLLIIPNSIQKTGVFVNEKIGTVFELIDRFRLDAVQLHGSESKNYCMALKDRIPVIKAINVSDCSDFSETENYAEACNYFLFDTKTSKHGGSGEKFDWNILNCYSGNIPFFLSGGICYDDAEAIKNVRHPSFYGIDLNSRFETEPGIKDVDLLENFINIIKR